MLNVHVGTHGRSTLSARSLSRRQALRPVRGAVLSASLVVALIAGATSGCAGDSSLPKVVVHGSGGDVVVHVELALTEAEQTHGLMFRSDLVDGDGMLFVFDTEEERAFWMRNTPIPLDILYITGDATIRSIAAGTKPYSEETIPSRGPCRYVLEVPGGWSARHGVHSGDKVTLPDVAAARNAS